MVQRTPRWRKPPPKVLSTSESKRVVHCYAIEGKADTFHPLALEQGAKAVLMNPDRIITWVPLSGEYRVSYGTNFLPPGEWRVLGWRPPNNQPRHGEYDAVDPDLADWDALPEPNRRIVVTDLGAASRREKPDDIVPWDENGKPDPTGGAG